MRTHFYPLYISLVFIFSCARPGVGLFAKKQSAHEKYADSIIKAGYNKTPAGKAWLKASELSLSQPFQLQLPYTELGYFNADIPTATAFEFEVKRGTKIYATFAPGLFADLFEVVSAGNSQLLISAESKDSILQYVVKNDTRYVLRLQPEIGKRQLYQVQLYTAPSLSFPVQRTGNPKIISLWGAGRDNGIRTHEGVDIAAAFRTPALAAANGRVTSVSENKLGGKVVFISPDDADFNLYYAHLDTQIVQQGQRVNTGDVVGLVGNTGNAQYTAPHLHFGIYTNAGAIDPLLFIDNRQTRPGILKISNSQLDTWVQSHTGNTLYNGPSLKNTKLATFSAGDSLLVSGINEDWARVSASNGQTGYIKRSKIKRESKKK